MKVALLDAGPMVALFDPKDRHHRHFRGLLTDTDNPVQLHTTWPCVTEASHLLDARQRVALLRWIGMGAVQVFPFDPEDLLNMSEWMLRYTEVPKTEMDMADATLYWVAHETGMASIFTLDVRDFSRYRLPDGRAFEIA